jgi:tetratricopeptide (TPR) repeat protein
LLGRTYEETVSACKRFEEDGAVNSLFHITYWLGKRAGDEQLDKNDREITFSSALRERVGHHHHGEVWAIDIKQCLSDRGLLERPLHIISANPHSVMNSLYAQAALQEQAVGMSLEELTKELSLPQRAAWRTRVFAYAQSNGMIQLEDGSGANITVQIFDTAALDPALLPADIQFQRPASAEEMPVIIVMDYAFGEQAYAAMPKNQSVCINYAAALLQEQGYSKALEVLKPHYDSALPNVSVLSGLISCYRSLFMKREADDLLAVAEKHFGDKHEIIRLKADTLAERSPEDALTSFKAALEKDPKNIELRFFRFSTQSNVPALLNYSSNINEDKMILMNYLKINNSITDKDLYQRIKSYMLKSTYCSASEKQQLTTT